MPSDECPLIVVWCDDTQPHDGHWWRPDMHRNVKCPGIGAGSNDQEDETPYLLVSIGCLESREGSYHLGVHTGRERVQAMVRRTYSDGGVVIACTKLPATTK